MKFRSPEPNVLRLLTQFPSSSIFRNSRTAFAGSIEVFLFLQAVQALENMYATSKGPVAVFLCEGGLGG